MKNENRVSNSDYLRNLLEALEQSLASTAQSLDNFAISLENAYFASREPEVWKSRRQLGY